jgi:predicted membrane protein
VWYFDGGVGSVTLDLAGAWPAGARIRLNMALGGVKLLVPQQLGLRVRMGGFLAKFDGSGFSKSGRTYTSAGYERATRRVEVEVSSALGGVRVEWR